MTMMIASVVPMTMTTKTHCGVIVFVDREGGDAGCVFTCVAKLNTALHSPG